MYKGVTMKVSVILPTYEESMNILQMISKIREFLPDAEVIVSDDDSPDLTWKVVNDAKLKNVRVVRRYKNKGVGPSIYDGIKIAKGEIIIWMDADLTMPVELLPKMVSLLSTYDVIVGSRYVKGGADKRSLMRIVTSRMINVFTNIVLNFKVLDYDSGFVATKKEVFDAVGFTPKGHGEYCIEFLYNAGRKGYKIKEVPYIFRERIKGESKSAQYLTSILKYGFIYVMKVLSLRFNRK